MHCSADYDIVNSVFVCLLLTFRALFENALSYTFSKSKKRLFTFLPARRYASAGLCDSNASVRPAVCHEPVATRFQFSDAKFRHKF